MRGQFDVSQKILPGQMNALAVRIEKNATPGSCKQKTYEVCAKNGGALGSDNPTYHASIGWDWIPTMRGRDIGIWGDVSLSVTEAVTIENTFVSSKLPLPDTSSADLTVQTDLINHQDHPFDGTLHFQLGEIKVQQRVQLAAGERKTITLDPSTNSALHLKDPKLWWPVGYGDPHLYDAQISRGSRRKTAR